MMRFEFSKMVAAVAVVVTIVVVVAVSWRTFMLYS